MMTQRVLKWRLGESVRRLLDADAIKAVAEAEVQRERAYQERATRVKLAQEEAAEVAAKRKADHDHLRKVSAGEGGSRVLTVDGARDHRLMHRPRRRQAVWERRQHFDQGVL